MAARYSVRRLAPGDEVLLSPLQDMFGRAFEDPASYGARPPSPAYQQRLLGSDYAMAFVALDGAEVVGGLTAYELPKFEQERSEIYIYDLAVAVEHRRQGIATALIGAVQLEATRRRAWVVFVQADHGDEPAIALYTKFGTREDVLHFDIPPA
jgi:aminoglycoside 3-N-acetyltransferase I